MMHLKNMSFSSERQKCAERMQKFNVNVTHKNNIFERVREGGTDNVV